MPLANDLQPLVDAVAQEETDYVNAQAQLPAALAERDSARGTLDQKQAAVDDINGVIGTERTQLVDALRALRVRLEELLALLEAGGGPAPPPQPATLPRGLAAARR